ncbi:MAG: helix-turn-helix domain-containing protein [Myxococcota bacterium]
MTPDPRCAKSIDDRILRTLAESGMSNARATAEKLGAPLRSVQHALKRLVDEGACFVEKQGRAVHYRIEDTTFFEPTRERLRYAAVDPRHPS